MANRQHTDPFSDPREGAASKTAAEPATTENVQPGSETTKAEPAAPAKQKPKAPAKPRSRKRSS